MSQLGKRGFPDPALAQRPLGLQRFNLGQHHDGKGVGVLVDCSRVLAATSQSWGLVSSVFIPSEDLFR